MPRPYHQSQWRTTSTESFDPDSGLVFTEISCKGTPMTADWMWKTTGSTRAHGRFRSIGPGCDSLFNMALRSASLNSFSITAENLEILPWGIGQKLWECIRSSQLDSLHVWKAFALAYAKQKVPFVKRRQHVIYHPTMSFIDYINPLKSSSFSWLTFLTLANITCLRSDLAKLSLIVNLAVLTVDKGVRCPDFGLEDGVLRAWGRSAVESDGFSMLRVISLRGQRYLSSQVFSYLQGFPALALLILEGCSIGINDQGTALRAGWKYSTGQRWKGPLAEVGGVNPSWDSVVHETFLAAGAFSIERITAERVEVINALPMLHFSLAGTPREAHLDAGGNHQLQCFERSKGERIAQSSLTGELKRPFDDVSDGSKAARKKPMIRASKQQDLNAWFAALF